MYLSKFVKRVKIEKLVEEYKQQYVVEGIDVTYDELNQGIGVFIFRKIRSKAEEKKKKIETLNRTPLILLPGIGNTIEVGGEYRSQITSLINELNCSVYYFHLPFNTPFKLNDFINAFTNYIQYLEEYKIVGLSFGSDLIIELIHRGIINMEKCLDVLLLSPYFISKHRGYGSRLKNMLIKSTAMFPFLLDYIWHNQVEYKPAPTTFENIRRIKHFRKEATVRYSKLYENKVDNITILWNKSVGKVGELASDSMQDDIEILVKNLTLNFKSKTPFNFEHGQISIPKNDKKVVSEILQWYLKDIS